MGQECYRYTNPRKGKYSMDIREMWDRYWKEMNENRGRPWGPTPKGLPPMDQVDWSRIYNDVMGSEPIVQVRNPDNDPSKRKPKDPDRIRSFHCIECGLVWRGMRQEQGYKGVDCPPPCLNCGDFDSTTELSGYEVHLAKRIGLPGADDTMELVDGLD